MSQHDNLDFEAALSALQKAVNELEAGQLPLEQALEKYEHAMALSQRCQQALASAELKIKQITQSGEAQDIAIDTSDEGNQTA
jgi:exodeoxyribonuclease VII small subunit